MNIRLIALLAPAAALLASCGVVDVSRVPEAEVEVVEASGSNAESGDSAEVGSENEAISSSTTDLEPDTSNEGAFVEGESDPDDSGAESDSDAGLELEAEPELDLTDELVQQGEPTEEDETPVAADVGTTTDFVLSTNNAEMSGNFSRPLDGTGTLTVDRASTATAVEDTEAVETRIFVLVEFQFLGAGIGTLSYEAFRLRADGEHYSPLSDFSRSYTAGENLNGTLIFDVPFTAREFALEGGVVDGEAGEGAAYEFNLEGPGTPDELVLGDGVIAATDFIGQDSAARMSGNPTRPADGYGVLTLDQAFLNIPLGDNDPGEGGTFVAVQFQYRANEIGTLREAAFRLEADGESYSPINSFSISHQPGRITNSVVLFRVPDTASAFSLFAGSDDGFNTTFEIVFP